MQTSAPFYQSLKVNKPQYDPQSKERELSAPSLDQLPARRLQSSNQTRTGDQNISELLESNQIQIIANGKRVSNTRAQRYRHQKQAQIQPAETKRFFPSTNVSVLYNTQQSYDPGMGTLGVTHATNTPFEESAVESRTSQNEPLSGSANKMQIVQQPVHDERLEYSDKMLN